MVDLQHILILRHGVTDSNAGGVVQGQLPVPLNEQGRRQAEALAHGLVGWSPRIELLISSDLPRTMQSAEPISNALNLPIQSDRAWRERCLGVLEGKTVGQQGIWEAATGSATPVGAETLAEFDARVRGAFVRLMQRPQRVIAVMTHGGCCRAILRMLIDGRLPAETPPAEPDTIANCSVMQLTVRRTDGQPRISLACINRTFEMNEAERSLKETDRV